MKLGDWVHCTRCIRKTGNHYEVIPAENTMDNAETALYFERGAESPVEVDGFHDCERIKFADMQLNVVTKPHRMARRATASRNTTLSRLRSCTTRRTASGWFRSTACNKRRCERCCMNW